MGLAAGLALVAAPGMAGAQVTTRVSVDSAGTEGDGFSFDPFLAKSAQLVVFESDSSNLVAGDGNDSDDIFVHDLKSGETTRVSVDSTGTEGDDGSFEPHISGNGQLVVFESDATNLVVGDSNDVSDVFVHDLKTGETTRVSVDSAGVEADEDSSDPQVSANGKLVVFESDATNLVAGDGNGFDDIFVHDLKTGETTRVSVDSAGVEADQDSFDPRISGNGQLVVFESDATNLVAGDSNDVSDVFVHDLKTGETTRVSVDSAGVEADEGSFDPQISGNGQLVVFESEATNLVTGDGNGFEDIFVHDLKTGTTTRVSVDSAGAEADEGSFDPHISGNGKLVVFESDATNLVAGDGNDASDVFVHDLKTGETTRVSVSSTGAQGDNESDDGFLDSKGRFVAFESEATNLVTGDTNDVGDIFVRELE